MTKRTIHHYDRPVTIGPPKELMVQLRDRYKLRDFIETGTFYGKTAVWAASNFDNVITIECSKEIYDQTKARHDGIQNINFIFGDSRSVLKEIVPKLTRPCMFWLDGHWSGAQTYGENDECPLIEEIGEINMSTDTHFLFIDDARLFTSPPPRPHHIERWPSIDKVIEAVKSSTHKYYIVLIEDLIIALPEYAKRPVADYCQRMNTKAWDEYVKKLNASSIKQGCTLINQGLSLVGQDLRVQLKQIISKLAKDVMFR
jgi:hypothetical protein